MQTALHLESAHNARRASWTGIVAPPSVIQSALTRTQRRSSLFTRPQEVATERRSSLTSLASNQSSRPERRNSLSRAVKRLSMDAVQLLRATGNFELDSVKNLADGRSGSGLLDSKRASRIVTMPSAWKERKSLDSAALHLPTNATPHSSTDTTKNALGLLLERLDTLSAQRRSSVETGVRFSEDDGRAEAEDLASTLEYRLDDDDDSDETGGRRGVGMASAAVYRPGSTRASSTLICGSQVSSRRGSTELGTSENRRISFNSPKVAAGTLPVPATLANPGHRHSLRRSASIVALFDGKSAFAGYAVAGETHHSSDDERGMSYYMTSQQTRMKHGSSYRELTTTPPSTLADGERVEAPYRVPRRRGCGTVTQEAEVPEDIIRLALVAEKVLVRLQIEDGVDAVLSRV